MTISRKFVPSLFTILSAFCGFMSVINSSNGYYDQACLFILYAALLDTLDGFVARMLNSESDFGVELDSLADVISFGVAPSYLVYSLQFKDYNGIGILLSSMLMVFSAIRLARFNISLVGYDKNVFTGIPTPAMALTIVSYIYFYHDKMFSPHISSILLIVLTIGFSFLMVSNFKYPTLPKLSSRVVKKNPFPFILLLIAIIISFVTKGYAITVIFLVYIFYGIVVTFYKSIFRRKYYYENIGQNRAVKKHRR